MGIISILKSKELYRLRKYRIYKVFFSDYKKRKMNFFKILSIHRKGFMVSDWNIMGLNKDNYKSYLSSKQYNKYHPINGYYSKIIDDKTVIKYVVNGTECAKNMPDYYFLIDEDGIVCPMMDYHGSGNDSSETAQHGFGAADVRRLLEEKGKLAVKMATGSIGQGFYKAEYKDGLIRVNGEEMTGDQFDALVSGLKNYIISEYLTPHKDLAKIWPDTANTIRYLVGKKQGEFRLLKAYIRFGSKKSGVVENFNKGGVMCYLDPDGYYDGGYVLVRSGKGAEGKKFIKNHPDNGEALTGRIPLWDELVKAAEGLERLLPMTKYLGFDFVVTDTGGVKLIEINSLTSLDTMQADCSILETENGKWFFSDLKEM